MKGPGITYYIMCEAIKKRIVHDENNQVFRSKEDAESYAKRNEIENYKVIDAETYMKAAQRSIANRRQ